MSESIRSGELGSPAVESERAPEGGPARRVVFAGLALGLLAVGVLCLTEVLSSWVVLAIASLPWLYAIGARMGVSPAFGAVILGSLWALLATMMVTPIVPVPMLPAVVVIWTLAGLAGLVSCARVPVDRRRPSRMDVAVLAPSLVGGVVWLAAIISSHFVNGAAKLAWVMLGDSANNVQFARDDIYRNGIAVGDGENPVPLPNALMAIVMATGRDDVAPSNLLRHDIEAFTQVWMLLIALICVTVGVTAASIARARSDRPLVVGIVSAGASLAPLSWFFSGYPIEFGFFNSHVAFPIVLAAFLVYLGAAQQPVVPLALLAIASTLLLAVWSPLVLMPVFLGIAILVRSFKTVLAARGKSLWFLIFAFLQLIVYGIAVVLPSLARNGGFLTAPGGSFGFRKWMIAALAIAALALAVLAFRRLRNPILLGTIAIVGASAVGLGALLFVTRNEENPWSYYPLKFAWLAAVIIVVLILGLAPAVIARYFRPLVAQLAGLAVVAVGTIGFLNWAPSAGVGYVWMNPIERIVTGQVLGEGDKVADEIFTMADPEQSHILWNSGHEFEGAINFWVMQMWADSMTENLDLKRAAYGLYDLEDVNSLCRVVGLMGGGTIVETADPLLAASVESACPEQQARVVMVP